MVDPSHGIAFVSDARSREKELGRVAIDLTVGKREQCQIRLHDGSDGNRLGHSATPARVVAYDAVPGIGRQRVRIVREPFDLPELLIIAKDEGLVLCDGSAGRASELVAPEWRLLLIEGVARVQGAVP